MADTNQTKVTLYTEGDFHYLTLNDTPFWKRWPVGDEKWSLEEIRERAQFLCFSELPGKYEIVDTLMEV